MSVQQHGQGLLTRVQRGVAVCTNFGHVCTAPQPLSMLDVWACEAPSPHRTFSM